MIETQGPALEAESKYRQQSARDAFAVRRAADERRAAQAKALAADRTHGVSTAPHGWHLPGSGAWHVAR